MRHGVDTSAQSLSDLYRGACYGQSDVAQSGKETALLTIGNYLYLISYWTSNPMTPECLQHLAELACRKLVDLGLRVCQDITVRTEQVSHKATHCPD